MAEDTTTDDTEAQNKKAQTTQESSSGDVAHGASLAKGDFEPMKIETESEHNDKAGASTSSSWLRADWSDWLGSDTKNANPPRRDRLLKDRSYLQKSLFSLRFSVLSAAINTKMLNPNYPLMVSPNLDHPDAFESTEPFGFNSATYFLPMCSLLGVAIASVFLGQISDRLGRKSVMLTLSIISGFGSIIKYFCKETFWGFCIAQFVFGLFLGNLPVAMAWVGDVFESKKEKEDNLSNLVATFVTGSSGGGIIAILMQESGLFTPLWVGAGFMFLAAIFNVAWLIEPGDEKLKPIGKDLVQDTADSEDADIAVRPETIDKCTLTNIVSGALADNFGSTALFPLCLSPLALETYSIPYYEAGVEPILSITGYQWLSVMVAFLVVPATFITPYMFAWRGVAGTCVVGNAWTGVLTLALLLIATLPDPPTTASFAFFVLVMYGGFPVTVFSQLTTGPMLDIIAPADKIGFVQGLNNSAMNFGMALAPWLFGMLADFTTTWIAIWTGIGVSWFAALVNTPLMFKPEFGPPEKKPPAAKRPLTGEDKDLVEKALAGEFVEPQKMWELNLQRMKKGQPLVIPKVSSYEDDKDSLAAIYDSAEATFRHRTDIYNRVLAELDNPNREKDVNDMTAMLNAAVSGDPDLIQEANSDLGKWVADYLADNGYNPHLNSVIFKQMLLSAFPPVSTEEEHTPETLKEALIRISQIMNSYLDVQENRKYSWSKLLGNGGKPTFYS